MNTKIWFTYRDGANYKQNNSYILNGTFSDDEKEFLKDYKDAENLLIPNQVSKKFLNCCPSRTGLNKTIHGYEYNESFDHPYHGLEVDPSLTNEQSTVNMTCAEFVDSLKNTVFDEENY